MLRQSVQLNIFTLLAMQKKFQLEQRRQTLEPARLRPEELCRLSHPILAALAPPAGAPRRK